MIAAKFLVFVLLGVYLRKPIEKGIGVRETLQLTVGLGALGAVLFAISPQFIIILGLSLGMLISRQIESNHLLFQSSDLGKRSFLYSILIASAVLLLFPFQYYPILIWITAGAFIVLAIATIAILKDAHLPYFRNFTTSIKYYYPKGIIFGLLLIFLLNPLFIPERFFFHLFWGVENFPSRLALRFTVAAIYFSAILFLEILRVKTIILTKSKAIMLVGGGFFSYLVIPFLIQNVFIFILSLFVYISGIIVLIDVSFIRTLPFSPFDPSSNITATPSKGHSGFISQSLFWIIIGLFLFYIPPTIIVVDAQSIFAMFGLTGIEQLTWSPAFWTLFYTPALYMFLCVPITIFVVIFGIFKSF